VRLLSSTLTDPAASDPGVRLLDSVADEISQRRAAEIRKRLERNRRRREKAKREVDAARDELVVLLVGGREAGLTVTAMAHAAGVSRETAHQLLKR
jgi:hypothetical protein